MFSERGGVGRGSARQGGVKWARMHGMGGAALLYKKMISRDKHHSNSNNSIKFISHIVIIIYILVSSKFIIHQKNTK